MSRIADLLKGITNYHRLSGELNIKMATVFEIQKNCLVYNTISEKCYRKKLVQMYCESTGSKASVVMHIAQALDSMDKYQQLAETIRKEIPIAGIIFIVYTLYTICTALSLGLYIVYIGLLPNTPS